MFQHIPYQIPKAHPEIEVTEEFSRAANARVLAHALPTLEQTFYFHNCLFSGDFVYTNFESTSFWQIYFNGLKLNNAAVTSRLSIAALLSLSTPSCPLKSTPSIGAWPRNMGLPLSRALCSGAGENRDVGVNTYLPGFTLSSGVKCGANANLFLVRSLLVSSRSCSVPPAVSGASRSAKEVLFLEQ